jgi:hypothetical protein
LIPILHPQYAQPSNSPNKYTWRVNLFSSETFWEEWFTGMSDSFLECPAKKLLILCGTDRLDTKLLRGQMQGELTKKVNNRLKYTLLILPEWVYKYASKTLFKFSLPASLSSYNYVYLELWTACLKCLNSYPFLPILHIIFETSKFGCGQKENFATKISVQLTELFNVFWRKIVSAHVQFTGLCYFWLQKLANMLIFYLIIHSFANSSS